MIRCRHMGMRTDHKACAPVAEIADGLFFARRFGMKIHHDRIRYFAQRTGFQLAVDGRKRIVERPS